MAIDDWSSSSSEEWIQPPSEKEPKLGEKSESGGERMNYDFVAACDYRDTQSSEDDEDGGSAEEEEEDEVSTDVEAERLKQQIGDDDEDYLAPGVEKIDHKKFIRYWRQIRLSERFDIKFEDYPGPCDMAPVVPLHLHLLSPKHYSKLIGFTKEALKDYNSSNGKNYEFKEIVSVTSEVCAGFMYYITFKAMNRAADDAVEIFRSRVYAGIDETEVDFCRPVSGRVN